MFLTKKFKIMIFGRNKKGKSVSLHITDFSIFFYLKVPNNWTNYTLITFKEWIKKNPEPKAENYRCYLRN